MVKFSACEIIHKVIILKVNLVLMYSKKREPGANKKKKQVRCGTRLKEHGAGAERSEAEAPSDIFRCLYFYQLFDSEIIYWRYKRGPSRSEAKARPLSEISCRGNDDGVAGQRADVVRGHI